MKKELTDKEIIEMCKEIYKKTLAYSLDKVVLNENGTRSHIHSDEFLDKHPERVNTPEFTNEEEKEEIEFLWNIARSFATTNPPMAQYL